MLESLDIAQLRADTPGTTTTTTSGASDGMTCTATTPMIHFNNAGASLMPAVVRDAVVSHVTLEAEIGGYEAAARRKPELEDLYCAVAELIHAEPNEIAIMESATAAWINAFYSIPFRPGDVVLTSGVEYAANYVALLQESQRKGIVIEHIPSDDDGAVSVSWLEQRLKQDEEKQENPSTTSTGGGGIEEKSGPTTTATTRGRVRLVSITHVPTNGGLVNPCEAIGALLASLRPDILYLVDACQTVGQKPINVDTLHCHLLSATSRKYLRGPRGVGFLYVRSSVLDQLDPVAIDHFGAEWVAVDEFRLRPDARRFEKWESSIANRLGLRAAVRYFLSLDQAACWRRIVSLADSFRRKLPAVAEGDQRIVVCDLGSSEKGTRCGIVSFFVENCPNLPTATAVVSRMREHGVNLSVSSISSTRVDMAQRQLNDVCRASLHYYNTEEEVDTFMARLRQVIAAEGS